MKTEMSVPYQIMAVSADQSTIIAKTNSGSIYAISSGNEEHISLVDYQQKLLSGKYLKITINEIKRWLKRDA